ncbi:MAG: tetratricopeptide repeat protein [Pyrinomonadaceae bacterium]
MKRCPQCNRVEPDDALVFCRVDGAALTSDSGAVGADSGTVKFGSAPVANEIETSILPHRTDADISRPTAPTTMLPAQQSTPGTTRELKRSKRVSSVAIVAGAIFLIAILAGSTYLYLTRKKTPAIESIAVMPFVNESGNADVEYLSDGMTDTLIASLSQLPNLSVKARSSVFRYKGKETDAKTLGKDLNVQAILNGRVVQHGDQLTLSLELVDVATENAIWSQQYIRRQSDLVTLQSEIARDVSVKLKTKLSGADEARVTKAHTTNPEAYQLYLKGKYHYSKYEADSYLKAIEYYKQAIEIDPNYALPYYGIAAAYDWANGWYLPPKEAEPKAKAAAVKALELDETLAETHFLLGKIIFWYEWDWTAAEREWKRANELDPTYPVNYPVYLASIGRFDEAIEAQESVLRRLPLDLNMNMDAAGILLFAGQTDRSIEQTRKALELDPKFWWAYQNLGLAYERKKQYSEAIAALEKALTLDNNTSILGYLGYVYAASGKKAEAQKVLVELQEISKQRYVSPYSFAVVYAGLNDQDQAFEWLDRAYEARSFSLALLKVDTVFDNLHADPRFKELLKRMNLPE